MEWTGLLLVATAAVALAGLAVGTVRTRALSAPATHAPSRGSEVAGVRYALTTAFAPWAKESARIHLPTYLAGVVFHLALFLAIALALATALVPAVRWPVTLTAPVLAVGLACGLGLLAKRALTPRLRALSVPEDYLANLLADATLAAAVTWLVRPGWLPALHICTTALLLYLPLGKLRHVIFLLASRLHWGRGFGRRGVLPRPARGRG